MTPKISLYELNGKVRIHLNEAIPDLIWVIAEINEINTNKSGHCYLELVEKDPATDSIIAKARATVWAYTFRLLKPYFETTTGQSFSSGIKVLLKVKIEFHELFGYSLNVHDIDPTYTVGDLARQKIKAIEKLKKEGIFSMNRELDLPLLSSNIAIISSKTAAGLQDFTHQLKNNPYAYTFNTLLFPSLMQGKEAEESIIHALDRIFMHEDFFDVVIIIRGGGSQTDLSCFNNYLLASHIAQFPLPVITGIGHEKDESVTDMVASYNLKTPTAVAEFLIQSFLELENKTKFIQEQIINNIGQTLSDQKRILDKISIQVSPLIQNIIASRIRKLDQIGMLINSAFKNYINFQKDQLRSNSSELKYKLKDFFTILLYKLKELKNSTPFLIHQFTGSNNNKLDVYQQSLKLLDPANILKRGYSLTYSDHKLITNAAFLKEGQILNTKFSKGRAVSTVKNIILGRPESDDFIRQKNKAK